MFRGLTMQLHTGGFGAASALIGRPVAKRIGADPPGLYLAQLDNRQFSHGLERPVPPRQIWCLYASVDAAAALVITSPKTLFWSSDRVGLLLGILMPRLLRDEPGFETKQIETSYAFAYLVGPSVFIDSAVVEWVES